MLGNPACERFLQSFGLAAHRPAGQPAGWLRSQATRAAIMFRPDTPKTSLTTTAARPRCRPPRIGRCGRVRKLRRLVPLWWLCY